MKIHAALCLLVVGCRSGTASHAVEGTVRDAQGQPVHDARVYLTSIDGTEATAIVHAATSASGSFSLDRGGAGVLRFAIATGDRDAFGTPVVIAPDDRTAIHIDVTLGEPPVATFDAAHADLAAFVAIPERFRRDTSAMESAYDAYIKAHGNSRGFAFDPSQLYTYLLDQMQHAHDLEARELAAGYLLRLRHYGRAATAAEVAAIIDVMPPESPLWALDPELVKFAALAVAKPRPFLGAIVARNPSRVAQAHAQLGLAREAYLRGDDRTWAADHAELVKRYGDVKPIRFEMRLLDPAGAIVRGKPVPAFEAPLLDGGTVSNTSLAGRYYLLDFWATWCGPCIGEMPLLDRAYEKFKDKNFTIVSVSLDEDAAPIAAFRAKAWPMPWSHVFIKSGAEAMMKDQLHDKLAVAFGVDRIGLPRAVLVGPDGTILATQDELFDAELDATLTKLVR